jgi:hypothetical protein
MVRAGRPAVDSSQHAVPPTLRSASLVSSRRSPRSQRAKMAITVIVAAALGSAVAVLTAEDGGWASDVVTAARRAL